jgi:ABC-type antimicrobial peptide transport system permease subunit
MIINGLSFEIVGVAREEFRGPMDVLDVEIYAPIMMQREIQPGFDRINARGNNMMNGIARLRDGTSMEKAQEFMDAHLVRLNEEFPGFYEQQLGTTLVRQTEAGIHPMFRSAQVGLSAVMMVVVALLLLIACVNVANLFLVRARERRREMGIRLSLGAGGRRIVQQLLTESVVFSLLAGGVGLAVSRLAMGSLARFQPPMDGPFFFEMPLDGMVLVFTLAISVVAGLVFGLAPALQAASPDPTASRAISA